MENDRLAWQSNYDPEQSTDERVLKGTGLFKPQLILLIHGGDAKDCCAQNYERTVFRDQKVVDYAKKYFTSYRFDRGDSAGQAMYKKLKLEAKKPALLVMDDEGQMIFKAQLCQNPKTVHAAMRKTMASLKQKLVNSVKAEKKLASVQKLAQSGRYDQAIRSLSSIKTKRVTTSVRDRIDSQKKALNAAALRRLKEGIALEKKRDYEGAMEIYEEVGKSFRRISKVKAYATKCIQRVSEKRERVTTNA